MNINTNVCINFRINSFCCSLSATKLPQAVVISSLWRSYVRLGTLLQLAAHNHIYVLPYTYIPFVLVR